MGTVRVSVGTGGDLPQTQLRFDLSLGVRFETVSRWVDPLSTDEFRFIVRPVLVGSYEARPTSARWLLGTAIELGFGTSIGDFYVAVAPLMGGEASFFDVGARTGARLEVFGFGLELDYQYLHSNGADSNELRAVVYVDVVVAAYWLLIAYVGVPFRN